MIYGKFSEKLDLTKVMLGCAIICVFCYLLASAAAFFDCNSYIGKCQYDYNLLRSFTIPRDRGIRKKYKPSYLNINLIFITPYITCYQKNYLEPNKTKYDAILYPDIEHRPLRFAIHYRNKYMIEKSDFVVAYVNREWGGVYTAYKYACKKGKPIFNLEKINK